MKKILFLLFVLIGFSFMKNSNQITLLDSDGEAVSYIDYKENGTIFMWDGTPVAFIHNDRRDICIIGFNGKFLGWYEDGIIYDKQGYVAGARKGAVNMIAKTEKIKRIQKITPIRPITPISPIKPILRSRWSNTSLTEFLYLGKK